MSLADRACLATAWTLALLAAGTAIDFVLSDIEMPGGVDGVGLARWITAHRPGLPSS